MQQESSLLKRSLLLSSNEVNEDLATFSLLYLSLFVQKWEPPILLYERIVFKAHQTETLLLANKESKTYFFEVTFHLLASPR